MAEETVHNKPLVSILMLTYNQSEKVVPALNSLLDQTYSPLEILIADDCSSDDTYLCLQRKVEEYSRTVNRHKIHLFKNDKNLGVAKSCENIALKAKGELLVTSGGDDISYPNRVEKIVERWLYGGRKSDVIFHGFRPITFDGNPINQKWWTPTVRNPLGLAMGYSRIVVDKYPLISEVSSFEDCVLARRAYAFSDPLYIEDILVDYRQGGGMTSAGAYRARRARVALGMVASARQNLTDLEAVKGQISNERYWLVKELAASIAREYGAEYEMVAGDSFFTRFKGFLRYVRNEDGRHNFKARSFFTFYLPIIIPQLNPLANMIRRAFGKKTFE